MRARVRETRGHSKAQQVIDTVGPVTEQGAKSLATTVTPLPTQG